MNALRIALLSDIHANLPALEAVLADIDAAGLAKRFCLGDLVGYGPWPVETIARVRDAGIPTVQGNYDLGIGTRAGSCGCYYATDQARRDGEASYAFTEAAVGDTDAAWLAALPPSIRFEHDGCRVLLAHGSPRKVNEYLQPDRPASLLSRLADEAGADVVCIGHVHVPYHRAVAPLRDAAAQVHYVGSGSVGKPKDGDPRAAWVELALGGEDDVRELAPHDSAAGPAGPTGVWVGTVIHRVAYDVGTVARAIVAAGLPATLADSLLRA